MNTKRKSERSRKAHRSCALGIEEYYGFKIFNEDKFCVCMRDAHKCKLLHIFVFVAAGGRAGSVGDYLLHSLLVAFF